MTIVLPNIGFTYSLLTAKCIGLYLLIDYSTYFKEVNPILLLPIQSGVRVIDVFNDRN